MFKKASHQDILFFTKHLYIMIQSGIPIAEALEALYDQGRSKNFKKIVNSTKLAVENGEPLAKALAKNKKVFGQLYVSLIEVGEKSGTLEKTLKFLAEQTARDYALRKKVQAALFYPGLIISAATIMGGFISFFVLPRLVEFFESFEIELPLPTKILLFIAEFFKNYGIAVLIALPIFGFLVAASFRSKQFKPIWHRALLRIPLLGKFLIFAQLAHFCRNLGTMLRSGIPLVKALDTTALTLSNITFQRDVMRLKVAVEKGRNVADVLATKNYPNFPIVVTKMIGVGEKTGKLDKTLLYLSDFFEEEIDNISKNLTTILEPVLLIVIGLVIGFLALAIISPIYELTGSLRR